MSKIAILSVCLQALLVKVALARSYSGSYVTDNAMIDNDVTINNLAGYGGYGYPSYNLGYGIPGYGLGYGSLDGLGGTGVAVGNAGLALGGLGYGSLGYGDLLYGGLGYGSIGYGGLGYGGLANGGVVSSSGFAPVPDVAAVTSLPATGPLVSNGYAELGVAGAISALGTTIVTGQVPVMGAVSFSGGIPASGVVSIAGNCGCGGLQF